MAKMKEYSHAYKEQVYATWYAQNRAPLTTLYSLMPPDENGDKPAIDTLKSWRTIDAWDARADTTDIEISKRTDRELINIRMKMMKRHAEMSEKIAEQAYEHLQTVGFDSSTSAVNALFKAFEEEKKSRGMEVALTQVFSMSDDDLQKTMNRLLSRAKGLTVDEEKPVDGEVVEDAISATETTDA